MIFRKATVTGSDSSLSTQLYFCCCQSCVSSFAAKFKTLRKVNLFFIFTSPYSRLWLISFSREACVNITTKNSDICSQAGSRILFRAIELSCCLCSVLYFLLCFGRVQAGEGTTTRCPGEAARIDTVLLRLCDDLIGHI